MDRAGTDVAAGEDLEDALTPQASIQAPTCQALSARKFLVPRKGPKTTPSTASAASAKYLLPPKPTSEDSTRKESSPSPPPSSSIRRGKRRKRSQIKNPSDPLHRNPEFGLTDIEAANILPMAARTRPRGPPQKEDAADAHEERNMWTQIVNDLRRLKVINAKAKEIEGQILKMEAEMGPSPSSAELAALETLFRENLKLSEEEQKILNEEPNDVIKNVGILTALRTASESEPPRNPANSKSRNQKRQKIEKIEMMDGAADSPGPSPIATSAAASRLKANTVRSVSVPTTKEIKEVPVKIEEGAEGGKGPSAERAGKFFVGAEVAYKQAKIKEDGSQWIQCNIINITDIGNKKRYEVQDPEPDEDGAPGQIYKTGAQALIAIPQPGTPLPDYAIGKHVLARYPNTTTFYRAEVTAMKKGSCKLKFEEDQDQEMEVDRRFVLELSGK